MSRKPTLILPLFINPENEKLLDLAEQLIALYQTGIGLRRSELEEAIEPIILSYRGSKFLKGLNKLLLDRCEFAQHAAHDFIALRASVFKEAARLLKEGKYGESPEAYRDAVVRAMPETAPAFFEDCFGDLPDRERLVAFDDIGPPALLSRYNCALPQSLLLYAKDIELVFSDPRIEVCRQVFAYLKFFRLLATIAKDGDVFHIKIDGPLSLFEGVQRYGLALATFFPAILLLKHWQLRARVRVPGRRTYPLLLDESSGLKSHYQHFAAYIPEEFTVFKKNMKDASLDWQITETIDILTIASPSGQQEVITPDITLVSSSGRRVHVELFHRFHVGALRRRLAQAKALDGLILGVDRALARKKAIKGLLEKSPIFKKTGFLFNGFPTVSTLLSVLKQEL